MFVFKYFERSSIEEFKSKWKQNNNNKNKDSHSRRVF